MTQPTLFPDDLRRPIVPFKTQLLKWVGNKQRFAHEIISYFPREFSSYYEPFLGSGAVLASLSPRTGFGSDVFAPLVEIWQTLRADPDRLVNWYAERWGRIGKQPKEAVYEQVKATYNARPNGADLLFLCRSCYGGVVRFRKADGFMSTPCGVHDPIDTRSFARRVKEWSRRCASTEFIRSDYVAAMGRAEAGDLIYCDPPYLDSQAILYGAQSFGLGDLFEIIAGCKARGVFVALSIDGTKRSGNKICNVPIPDGLFAQEALVNCGRSMLRRFQMAGKTLEGEVVADRLLLTYSLSDG